MLTRSRRLVRSLFILAWLPSASALAQGAAPAPIPVGDLKFHDQGLTQCVASWALEEINQYKTAFEIKELSCAHAGIRSLQGIEQLPELLALDLSNNPIEDYAPLAALSDNLGFLWLWGNTITCAGFQKLRHDVPKAWIGGFHPGDCVP